MSWYSALNLSRTLLSTPTNRLPHQVLSGKGGVGKSSITTQLALSLSLAGHSVGILDIDLTGPSIPRFLGLEDAKITQAPGGWLPVQVHPSQVLSPIPASQNPSELAINDAPNPPAQNGSSLPRIAANSIENPISSIHAISLAFLLPSKTSAVVWRGPKKTAMVRQFLTSVLWPQIDYLLIDTPPGTSDEHISLAETLLQQMPPTTLSNSNQHQLAGAVIVTTPQAVAISDVRKEINFCEKVGIRVLGVVENMSGYVCECCGVGTNLFGSGGGEVMAGEFGVKFLGRVPVDTQWGILVEEGRRPRYGNVGVRDEEGELDGEENADDVGQNEASEEDNKALLVDKYRSCSLYWVFDDITRQLVEIVEGVSNGHGTA